MRTSGVKLPCFLVERRVDVALVIRHHEDSEPNISRAPILRLGSPFSNARGCFSGMIWKWNQKTSFFCGLSRLESHPPRKTAPVSEALASLAPCHVETGAKGRLACAVLQTCVAAKKRTDEQSWEACQKTCMLASKPRRAGEKA